MRHARSCRGCSASVLRQTGSLLVVLAAVLGGPSRADADLITVHIVNFDFTDTGIGGTHFDPVIHQGDTVEWVWNQGFHSTTSVAGMTESWNSTAMASAGQTFDHTFTHVGTFAYYCSIHGADNGNGTASGMAGVVRVTAAVPEPSSLVLCGIAGLSGLAYAWHRGRVATARGGRKADPRGEPKRMLSA